MINIKHAHDPLVQRVALLLMCACLANVASIARGEDAVAVDAQIQKFTNDELRALVAPIALYPDALLAQILPASAYPVDIAAAYHYVQSANDPANPPNGVNWDSSVIAMLHYPTVLKKMNDDLPWTERLGVAATYQMADVSETIQQVRAEAEAAGNLVTNDKQIVAQDQNEITIVPADPEIIYVPSYDPDVIFVHHDSWQPYISFGIGFGAGLWLTNQFDWRYHRIGIYNNWYNGGWRRRPGSNYWRAPNRPIPSWYTRGALRSAGPASNYGYRSGTNVRGGQTARISPPVRSNVRPAQPARPVAPARPAVTQRLPSTPLTHAEGMGNYGQQVQRAASRGAASRSSVQPARPAPAPRREPQARPAQNQNMMRPSSGQQTRSESSRGAASRSASVKRR